MSQETIRQALVTAVEAAKVGAPTAGLILEYDNRIIVDTQTQVDPFMRVNVVFMDGVQADLSEHAIHRFYGQLHLIAAAKEGAGMSEALALLDHFTPQIHRKTFNGVHMQTAKPAPSKLNLGWTYYPLLIPFWYDKIY